MDVELLEGWSGWTACIDTTIAPVASNVMKTDQGYVITVTVAPDQTMQVSSLEAPAPATE
jgi:hypothetical protein